MPEMHLRCAYCCLHKMLKEEKFDALPGSGPSEYRISGYRSLDPQDLSNQGEGK